MVETAFRDPDVAHYLRAKQPFLWCNPDLRQFNDCKGDLPVQWRDLCEAEENWIRLAPLLARLFPELEEANGIIESKLLRVAQLQEELLQPAELFGRYYVKADHDLPVAGSIKARGGIYEVLVRAETLAREAGFLSSDESPLRLADGAARTFFSDHTIAVGSTGNLGLSVGLAARALGFRAVVHMSSDAKKWKIERLKEIGAEVVQHEAEYSAAVDEARKVAEKNEKTYFVDDERSKFLFLGYSAAAFRLMRQIEEQSIVVDRDHPLFLYLPCGIGGAPGGVTFGAKHVFGDDVHCFFVEPVQSACALAQLASGLEKPVSVYDFGLTNKTEADGMAVACMSQFVASVVSPLLSGIFTASDDDLYRWLYHLQESEGIKVEPSAAASLSGPSFILNSQPGREYLRRHGLESKMHQATHILWATGGRLVPNEKYDEFLERGRGLVSRR